MTESQLTEFIRRYLAGEATEEEKLQVEQWYESFDASPAASETADLRALHRSTAESLRAVREKIRIAQKQAAEIRQKQYALKLEKRHAVWRHAAAAAAILLLVSGAALSLLHKKANKQQQGDVAVQPAQKDFEPGGNKAVLTLDNGRKIILDSSDNGLLSVQGNTKVVKMNNGLLAYNSGRKAAGKKQSPAVRYNTISTPRGGTYEVVLPDGSKVWLNAASSVRFPTAFTGKEREVQMTGEAYFEIAKNARQPFSVSVRGMKVKVLGTHFNIMAYDGETTIKTTLLEGAVKVSGGKEALLLRPGEMAQLEQNGRIKRVKDVDVNRIIAWKNNLFWFNNDDIGSITEQLERWYDVDIDVEGNIPDLFTGSIPRDLPFSKFFEILQKTGSIHYKIENGKIIITPSNN